MQVMQLKHEDNIYWCATPYLSGIGLVTLHRCLNHFGGIKNLFTASSEDLRDAKLNPQEIQAIQNPNWIAAEQDLLWAEKPGCSLITFEDPRYPILLKELHDAPALLYVKGSVEDLSSPQLAIVGSRNPTPSSKETAEHFASALTEAGLVITSGLASGVDAASHRGALKAGGRTIAVTGTGLNQIYPVSNRHLSDEITLNGCLLSEFSPNTPAIASNFPRRNRLISGLSLGVLVVEAALRSGSLITARYASEQGREVFAIPGSIHNPLARGCHKLIQQGAKLVEKTQDILEELGSLYAVTLSSGSRIPSQIKMDVDDKYKQILTYIDKEVTALNTIIVRSGLTSGEVSSMLLQLELQGYVHLVSGGYARSAYK